jgi:hypothetical protein
MQNNNPNDYLLEDGIDLKALFKLLINSKKLIIVTTLIITLLGAIYSFQKAPVYKSTALIEIGQYYDTFKKKNILLEDVKQLIQNLRIVFIHKSNDNKSLSIQKIENRLIKIEIDKPSIELGKQILDEVITYIENKHLNPLQRLVNQLKYKIESLNNQIENIKSLNNKIEYEKLRIANNIIILETKLPQIDLKIKALNKIILEDQANLKLLESDPDLFIKKATQSPTLNHVLHNYRDQLLDLEAKKINLSLEIDNLEIQLQFSESNNLESEKIFKLLQEKDSLELELAFLKQNSTKTQLVGKILTIDTGGTKRLIIFLSFIFGLFLSITIVLINNSLKAFKED